MKPKHFFSLFLAFFICGIAMAQPMKTLIWDAYKMKFQIYDNMTIMESNGNKFWAKNGLVNFDIFPRKGDKLDYNSIKSAIINWATESGVSFNAQNSDGYTQPNYIGNLNGYWGYVIEGKQNNLNASMLLLVDPNHSDISFFVWLSYVDGFYHYARKILSSIKPL